MSRRNFLGAGGAGLTAMSLGRSKGLDTSGNDKGQESTKPNVLIIYADEHRADCLGVMGNPDVKTPHTDALAADGALFRNAFCPWPVCTPSRYSLLTGLNVRQHRGFSNRSTLDPGLPTFPEKLRDEGYETTAVGKMHFNPVHMDVGFDSLILCEQNGPGRLVDDYHRYLKERDLIDSIDLFDQVRSLREQAPGEYLETFGAGRSNLPEAHHSTTWIGDQAVGTLSKWSRDKPSALMVGFVKPHHPFDPPEPWEQMYDPERLAMLPGWTDDVQKRDIQYNEGYFKHTGLSRDSIRRIMRYYYASISHMDAQVGRMVRVLKERGLYDNTLIIYTADHGEYMGFHHMLLKGNFLYDPVVKVPLVIKFPRQEFSRSVSDALVSGIDVTATILRQTGIEPTEDMTGRALQSVCAGQDPGREYVVTEFTVRNFMMIRTRTHKLLHANDPDQSLFFDLRADPLEFKDLYHDAGKRAEVRYLKDKLLEWFQTQTEATAKVKRPRPQVKHVSPMTAAAMQKYIDRKMQEEIQRLSQSGTSMYGSMAK